MELMPHQKEILDINPKKAILDWEMRVGKSLPASIWIDMPERAGNTYIITPKQNKKDWENFRTKAKVISKEEFKKEDIKNPTAIVVDEMHYFASPLFKKNRSDLSTKLYSLVKQYPDMHILGLTATPIRNDAWSLHTLLCYIGIYYDWKEWRSIFFELKKMPFLRFPTWLPKDDWRINIKPYRIKHCYKKSLSEIVEYLPPIETVFINVKQEKYSKPDGELVNWMHEHQYEQQDKHKEILKLNYHKLIIVVHYTEQIDDLKEHLEKEKPVFILDGRTKNADKVKRDAQEADDCYFIVQSSMGFGFDGYMFGATVFVSMSHSYVNHTQMLGRMRHPKHLKNLSIYYIFGGRWDKRIYDTINKGKDFNPHNYND